MQVQLKAAPLKIHNRSMPHIKFLMAKNVPQVATDLELPLQYFTYNSLFISSVNNGDCQFYLDFLEQHKYFQIVLCWLTFD